MHFAKHGLSKWKRKSHAVFSTQSGSCSMPLNCSPGRLLDVSYGLRQPLQKARSSRFTGHIALSHGSSSRGPLSIKAGCITWLARTTSVTACIKSSSGGGGISIRSAPFAIRAAFRCGRNSTIRPPSVLCACISPTADVKCGRNSTMRLPSVLCTYISPTADVHCGRNNTMCLPSVDRTARCSCHLLAVPANHLLLTLIDPTLSLAMQHLND